jgi:serine/threonine protein kinase
VSVQPSSARKVGDYQLLTKLGEGGMGVVYLARRPDGPRVALKVLRPHIVGDDEARARLAREVASLERIRSRWIAEIVDADPWAPVPYVATRYVPGLSLHDHVPEEGPIRGIDLRWFARCLAEGLAGVHAVGVLHRDVKPSNVLLEGRTPILIDFGLARVADDPRLTHTGWFLGTPGYLAPEILHGDAATAASDVHSWAATVAFAGTGNPPFGRGPSMAIMDRVRRGEHDLEGLPDDLRGIVAAALQPDPGRRPRLGDIRGWLGQDAPAPVASPPPVEDPFTLPLALAAHDRSEAETWVPDHSSPVAPTSYDEWSPPPPQGSSTRQFPTEDPDDLPVDLVPVPAQDSKAVGLRRAALVACLGAVAAAAMSAWPYLGLAAVLTAAWLLRACSMIATARSDRRRLRGACWYDVLMAPLSAPWYLVASIPGSLLLGVWSLGLGAAGALLAYAVGAGTAMLLFVAGLCLVVSLWIGPGSAHVRWPARVVAQNLARRTFVWAVSAVLLLGLAGLVGQQAAQRVSWTPFGSPAHMGSFLPRP